jgi:hypothetical protein
VNGPSSSTRPPSRKPRESPLCTAAELADVRDRLVTMTARAAVADAACEQAQRGNSASVFVATPAPKYLKYFISHFYTIENLKIY